MMSKSSGGKHEKFSCIANCLPIKGSCFHKGSKQRMPSSGGNLPSNPSIAFNLTGGASTKNESAFQPLDHDDGRMAHTKQWLANLSTMVSVDPSHLDDSELSGMDRTLTENQSPCNAVDKGHHYNPHHQYQPSRVAGERQANEADYRPTLKENHYSRRPSEQDDSISKAKVNDSLSSDMKYADSFLSSADCDSSHLSSSRCCSQQQTRRRRRRLDRSNCLSSSSTLGLRGHDYAAGSAGGMCGGGGDTSSIYSGSSSTVSLATELITLDMDACRHLGITIVGHSNSQGDCGIFVGCVKKGGAAALNGHIEPGDLILEVNEVDLERMSNERALAVLKGELAKGGLVKLLVAKYWDMNDDGTDVENHQLGADGGGIGKDGFRHEPVYEAVGSVWSGMSSSKRPNSMCSGSAYDMAPHRGGNGVLKAIPEDNVGTGRARQFHEATGMSSSDLEKLYDLSKAAQLCSSQPFTSRHPVAKTTASSSSSSVHTGYPDSGYHDNGRYGTMGSVHSLPQHSLTLDRRLRSAAAAGLGSAFGSAGSGLDSTQPRPFRGIELIDWILGQVSGLRGRREAQLYAQNLLLAGHIYGVEPSRESGAVFQEHCYYTFGKQTQASNESLESKML